MNTLSVEKLDEGLYSFEEVSGNSVNAYFVIGEKRALMIDALESLEGLYAEARKLTGLPLDVVIAHGHGDHCGPGAGEFAAAGCKVYMDRRDEAILAETGSVRFPAGFFTELKGIERFDLGETVLELIPLPGHTPGSVMLLDREKRRLFSSDSVGSGPIWMQLPHSLPLHVYYENLKGVYGDLKQYDDLTVLCGHRRQSPHKLTINYIGDVLETAELILSGKEKGETLSVDYGDLHMDSRIVKHKSMLGFFYNPDNL
ncbi:MAG: MBL fold metallo-hydrolase [Treponema sp.]|jgi:glyoxylase-like metal-dependent hydrolase (beta-lactamase superfamily II)|nr:MBL fold metallo-hydrolase [Treponema sp.]